MLQLISTSFFGEQSPGDADLFAILDYAIPQCNYGIKMLCFSCLTHLPHSLQVLIHFQSVFGLLRIEIWNTSDRAGVFYAPGRESI